MTAGAALAATTLSGCVSSPTYGTDKTAAEQLTNDVSNIASFRPKSGTRINYQPRPDLVRPGKGAAENLPAPQQSVASTDNPGWVESPEAKRARLRADATENSDDPTWRAKIDNDTVPAASSTPVKASNASARVTDSGIAPVGTVSAAKQREMYKEKRAETQQGSATSRKFLSEPPLDYRQASATAPTDDLGEDEVKKERRLKAEARKKRDKKWSDLLPW